MEEENYLRDTEAAKKLGLSVQTLRNYRHREKGPAYIKRGRAVRYAVSDLDEYMRSRRVSTRDQE